MVKIKDKFLKNKEEINLVKFIAQYQYLSRKDIFFFFNSTSYAQKRITRLIKNNILRRYKKHLVLGKIGCKYAEENFNFTLSTLPYTKKYVDRLTFMSHLAAIFYQHNFIRFIPSFQLKEKTNFTETSRKYIGILYIYHSSYLVYHITEEHTQKYINSIMYDLQKEKKYQNIIILVNDLNRIDLSDFVFGFNSVLIVEDIDEQIKKLKYLLSIDWTNAINSIYGNVSLSKYNFCDYSNESKYISTFYFIDTEKINRIQNFLNNNNNKEFDIVCTRDVFPYLKQILLAANYNVINLSKFIKNIRIYD